jgi:hypothetical protein
MLEQEQHLQNMKLSQAQASTVQVESLHKLNKIVRQHSLDKDEAFTHAKQARDELSLVVKRADSRIMKLEMEIQNLVQGNIDMVQRDVERVQSMEQAERVLSKGKRQLQIDQDDLDKQKGIQASQLQSMTHHMDVKKMERKKMMTSHNKALDHMTKTSAIDREVCRFCIVFCPSFSIILKWICLHRFYKFDLVI